MSLQNLPLLFGNNTVMPIGRISINNENVEKLLMRNVAAMLDGRDSDVIKLEVSYESRVQPSGIQILSFAFLPVPVVKKE